MNKFNVLWVFFAVANISFAKDFHSPETISIPDDGKLYWIIQIESKRVQMKSEDSNKSPSTSLYYHVIPHTKDPFFEISMSIGPNYVWGYSDELNSYVYQKRKKCGLSFKYNPERNHLDGKAIGKVVTHLDPLMAQTRGNKVLIDRVTNPANYQKHIEWNIEDYLKIEGNTIKLVFDPPGTKYRFEQSIRVKNVWRSDKLEKIHSPRVERVWKAKHLPPRSGQAKSIRLPNEAKKAVVLEFKEESLWNIDSDKGDVQALKGNPKYLQLILEDEKDGRFFYFSHEMDPAQLNNTSSEGLGPYFLKTVKKPRVHFKYDTDTKSLSVAKEHGQEKIQGHFNFYLDPAGRKKNFSFREIQDPNTFFQVLEFPIKSFSGFDDDNKNIFVTQIARISSAYKNFKFVYVGYNYRLTLQNAFTLEDLNAFNSHLERTWVTSQLGETN